MDTPTESDTQIVLTDLLSLIPYLKRADIITIRQAFEDRLSELKDKAKQELAERFEAERQALADRYKVAAEQAGLDLDSFSPQHTRTTLPAKYRNPENAEQTWSGRGTQPQWFKSAIASGVEKKDMLIL